MADLIRCDLDVVGSTQTIAENSINELKPGLWYLWTANRQCAGRGQQNKAWYSPEGNVYATYALVTETSQQCLPIVAAYTAIEVLQSFQVKNLKLKWINDLYIMRKKLGGVLVNTHSLENSKVAIVIGIGINVNLDETELKKVPCEATSMLMETGRMHNINEIINALSFKLRVNIETVLKLGFAPFYSKVNEILERFSDEVISIDDGSKVVTGKILEINQNGHLAISDDQFVTIGSIVKPF